MIAYGRHIMMADECAAVQADDDHSIVLEKGTAEEAQPVLTYQRAYRGIQGRQTVLGSDKPFFALTASSRWAYRIDKVAIFYWQSGSGRVRFVPLEGFNRSLLYFWTLHSVLPLKLSFEGACTMLHAAAVECASKAMLFLSPPFGGKSTLLEHFIQAGYTMISDDKLPIAQRDATFQAIPSYPFCATERILENLGSPVTRFSEQALPVTAAYVLHPVDVSDNIKIVTLRGIEKFTALRTSIDFSLSFLKPAQFRFLHAFAESIPVYRIDVPRSKALLPAVRRMVEAHGAAEDL